MLETHVNLQGLYLPGISQRKGLGAARFDVMGGEK